MIYIYVCVYIFGDGARIKINIIFVFIPDFFFFFLLRIINFILVKVRISLVKWDCYIVSLDMVLIVNSYLQLVNRLRFIYIYIIFNFLFPIIFITTHLIKHLNGIGLFYKVPLILYVFFFFLPFVRQIRSFIIQWIKIR